MGTVTLQFNGLAELSEALKKNLDMQQVKRVVQDNTQEMTQNATRLAPVDTGNLKRQISKEIRDGGFTGVTRSKAPYTGYVEYGTRFMNKQPFIKPSFEKQKVKFKSDLMRLAK